MSLSKNRRKKRQMKPRTFQTIKSARRYIKRFKWQFLVYGRYHKEKVKTMVNAIKIVRNQSIYNI